MTLHNILSQIVVATIASMGVVAFIVLVILVGYQYIPNHSFLEGGVVAALLLVKGGLLVRALNKLLT